MPKLRGITCSCARVHLLHSFPPSAIRALILSFSPRCHSMVYIPKLEPEGGDWNRPVKRRWVLAPPADWTYTGFEGLRILRENGTPFGLLLFQCLRDAHLWTTTPPQYRAGLFAPAGAGARPWTEDVEVPDVIARALAVLVQLPAEPAAVSPRQVRDACSEVSAWGLAKGVLSVESGFAVVAALAMPEDPLAAFAAGRAARRDTRFEQAEEWFRRSIGLARRADNDAAYASAYLGLGVLESARGNSDKARKRFVRAWRAARRAKLRKLAAAARHYMLPLAAEQKRFDEGLRHAIAAYKLYGATDHRLPALASDTGAFLLDHAMFATAIPLFRAAVLHLLDSPEIVTVMCNLARALAAVGDVEGYAAMWLEVNRVGRERSESYPAALIELAQGARTLKQWRRAQVVLTDALEAATETRDHKSMIRAQRLLADLHTALTDRDHPPPPEVKRFVTRFAKRLTNAPAP